MKQPASRIYPVYPTAGWAVISDNVKVYSASILTFGLRSKTVYLWYSLPPAPGGAPLQVQVEINYADVSGFWVPLGVPQVIPWVAGTTSGIPVPWTVDSNWSRISIQCPAYVAGRPWAVQSVFEANE